MSVLLNTFTCTAQRTVLHVIAILGSIFESLHASHAYLYGHRMHKAGAKKVLHYQCSLPRLGTLLLSAQHP